jgi:hypothetical protein
MDLRLSNWIGLTDVPHPCICICNCMDRWACVHHRTEDMERRNEAILFDHCHLARFGPVRSGRGARYFVVVVGRNDGTSDEPSSEKAPSVSLANEGKEGKG